MSGNSENGASSDNFDPTKQLARTQQLSFYYEPEQKFTPRKQSMISLKLEEFIRKRRLAVQSVWAKYLSTKNRVSDAYNTAKSHSQSLADYFRSEPVLIERIGIITIAALTGVVIAYQKSAFRKMRNAIVLGGSATAVCYPYQTVDYSRQLYSQTVEPARDWIQQSVGADYRQINTLIRKNPRYYNTTSTISDETTDQTKEGSDDPGQSNSDDTDMYSRRD